MQTISPVFGVALILTKTLFARLMRSPLSSVPFFKRAFSPRQNAGYSTRRSSSLEGVIPFLFPKQTFSRQKAGVYVLFEITFGNTGEPCFLVTWEPRTFFRRRIPT